MYNPTLQLGQQFLLMEPLIYQLPYFKIAASKTETATDLKTLGIDLKGSENIKCEEDEIEDKCEQ